MKVNLTVVQYVMAGAILVVALVIALIAAILILRGVPTSAPQLISLFGTLGVLVALLSGLLGVSANVGATKQIQSDVNGHLDAHASALPEQIRKAIDAEMEARGFTAPPVFRPPTGPPGGSTA